MKSPKTTPYPSTWSRSKTTLETTLHSNEMAGINITLKDLTKISQRRFLLSHQFDTCKNQRIMADDSGSLKV